MNRFAMVAMLAMLPAPAIAQSPALRIDAGGRSTSVPAITSGPTTGFTANILANLGAPLLPTEDGFRTVLFGDTLEFWIGSPFFRARGEVQTLASPVGSVGGNVLLPAQFFTEWVPAAHADRARYAGGVLTISGTIALPPAPGEKQTRIVVIDPGHGGPDTGKIGPNGLREKDAALTFSRKLAAVLTERGYEVHLTRTKDTLVALADRPRMANRWKNGRPAALFLSIHMNSTATSPRSARGFETFFLSEARTDDERRVAEMENAAIEFEDGPSAGMTEQDLILNGLRNDYYVRASSDLADAIQSGIDAVHDGPNRGVKRAGFRVLVGALMPAVLAEVAFISHPDESRLLARPAFQDGVAKSLADAIVAYFDAHEHLWSGLQ